MSALNLFWIAIVDDSKSTLMLLEQLLKNEPKIRKVSLFDSPEDLIEDLQQRKQEDLPWYDLILSDIRLGGTIDGPELMTIINEMGIKIPLVFMTGYPNYDDAVALIKKGAYDYIPKPDRDISNFTTIIQRILRIMNLERENLFFRNQYRDVWNFHGIIGKSPKVRAIVDIIKRISNLNARVLITGATGTGKELVARAIHNNGPRKGKKFLAVNCASIPENLLESELFGHIKGSFTSATRDKIGLFEEANGGTLFLDEIGDMGTSLQAKLLRILQDMTVRPVGSNQDRKIDVNVIAATNKNLKEACAAGGFREDLYYRLNTITIEIPPLDERREDIPLLINYFFKKYCTLYNQENLSVDVEAIAHLSNRSWPGNVRELEHTVERAIIFSKGKVITLADFMSFDVNEIANMYTNSVSKESFGGSSTTSTVDSSLVEERNLEEAKADTNYASTIGNTKRIVDSGMSKFTTTDNLDTINDHQISSSSSSISRVSASGSAAGSTSNDMNINDYDKKYNGDYVASAGSCSMNGDRSIGSEVEQNSGNSYNSEVSMDSEVREADKVEKVGNEDSIYFIKVFDGVNFKSLEQLENIYIEKLLQYFNNDKSKVANTLDLSMRTLYRKYKKLNDASSERDFLIQK